MLAMEKRMYDKINKCKIKTHLKSPRSHPHSLLPSYFSTNSALCCCCQDHHWPDIRSVDSTGNGAKQPTPSSFLGFSATCSLRGVGHRPRPLASRQQLHSLEECLKTAVPCSNSPLSGIKSELPTWKTGPFIITFQATRSLPNASFHSHPWTFAHAGLCWQRPSFHSAVCPANAHSSSKTSLLHYLLRSSFCVLPSLSASLPPRRRLSLDHSRLWALHCEDTSVPAPMPAGSKSTRLTSVHLCIPLLGPARGEQKVLHSVHVLKAKGQVMGPLPFWEGHWCPTERPLKRKPGEGTMF